MNLFYNSSVEQQLKKIEAAQKLSKSGGNGRAKALSPEDRSKIASKASKARWENLQANAC